MRSRLLTLQPFVFLTRPSFHSTLMSLLTLHLIILQTQLEPLLEK